MSEIIVKNRNKRAFLTEKMSDGNYFIRSSQDIAKVVNRYGKLENDRYRILKKLSHRLGKELCEKSKEPIIHKIIEEELRDAGIL